MNTSEFIAVAERPLALTIFIIAILFVVCAVVSQFFAEYFSKKVYGLVMGGVVLTFIALVVVGLFWGGYIVFLS